MDFLWQQLSRTVYKLLKSRLSRLGYYVVSIPILVFGIGDSAVKEKDHLDQKYCRTLHTNLQIVNWCFEWFSADWTNWRERKKCLFSANYFWRRSWCQHYLVFLLAEASWSQWRKHVQLPSSRRKREMEVIICKIFFAKLIYTVDYVTFIQTRRWLVAVWGLSFLFRILTLVNN